MTLSKPVRWTLANVGPVLWLGAGVMPIFGGAAKDAYRCRGHEFAGVFDECFNDSLPIGEFLAILSVLITFIFFVIFSRKLFDMGRGPVESDGLDLESKPNGCHAIAPVGAVWCVWRASTYTVVPDLLPFIGFWLVFALWFGVGAAYGWLGKRGAA